MRVGLEPDAAHVHAAKESAEKPFENDNSEPSQNYLAIADGSDYRRFDAVGHLGQ